MIKGNLEELLSAIEDARKISPYNQEVRLIAVSKTKPVEDIMEAYQCGIRDFGENKVQELCEKYSEIPSDVRWHLIGHLQRNKVSQVIGKTFLIHSVDSIRLAEEIENQASKKNIIVDILVQVNISGEVSKFGLPVDEVIPVIKDISEFQHVRVKGLMTIAPETDDMKFCRQIFKKLKNLSIDIADLRIDNVCMDFMSMGMSGDFTAAISEGANLVRIGTKVFGKRNYNI